MAFNLKAIQKSLKQYFEISVIVSFFAVVPLPCQSPDEYKCFCSYRREDRTNIYNCSSPTAQALPSHLKTEILNYSNMLVIHNTYLTNLCGLFPYLKIFSYLDFRKNNISSICESLANKLLYIVKSSNQMTSRHLSQIWLSGNPFHCNCEMTWMIGWLNNFTTITGEHIVVDYKHLKCHSGMMVGKKIYQLDKVAMGCFPPKMTLWQKIGIGITAGAAFLIITIMIIWNFKRSREFKFLMYYYLKLDTVPQDDKDENVDNMEYDAFFCYRYILSKYVTYYCHKYTARKLMILFANTLCKLFSS